MKRIKRVYLLIICLTLLMQSGASELMITVFAENAIITEQKVYSGATIDDTFADDRILVVLKNEASLEYLQTKDANFPEIKYKKVRNLTDAKGKRIKTMVEKRKNTSLMERLSASDTNVDEITGYQQVFCIELEESGKDKVLEAIALLEQRDDVLYVGPDYEISLCSSEPDDPLYDDQWAPGVIDLPEVWEIVPNPTKVLIGVLDTGIDASHPDLQGKVNTLLSKDFVSDDPESPTTDTCGHGTHVAGIIGAAAGNESGVAGTHWNVEFVSLRVLNSLSKGYISDFCKAIDYVVNDLTDRGADSVLIPILSFSGRWTSATDDEVTAMSIAIEDYLEYGGLFVCGAGNEVSYVKESGNDSDNPENPGNKAPVFAYPASLNFGYYENAVIVVGASNQSDNGLWYDGVNESGKEEGSNYGQFAVDIFAPGDTILSCYPSDLCSGCFKENGELENQNHVEVGYHYMSGTSMATPYVTGVAALIKSLHPSKSASEIKTLILNHADTKSWLDGKCVSEGRLNAYKALYASHTFGTFTADSAGQHSRVCSECNQTELLAHSFGDWKTDVYGCKSRTCADCDHTENQHLKSPTINQNDDSTHIVLYACCNTGIYVSHTWGSWANYNALNHRRVCAECGYEQLQKHRYLSGDATRTCTVCYRSEIISGGEILSIKDEEELLA